MADGRVGVSGRVRVVASGFVAPFASDDHVPVRITPSPVSAVSSPIRIGSQDS